MNNNGYGECRFVAVTNLMKPQPDHAARMARFALDVIQGIKNLPINPDIPNGPSIELRVGIHSGEVAAGVVGVKNLRYCLFGHSMNIASRMESSGEPGKIQLTTQAANMVRLDLALQHRVVRRPGMVDVKGQGRMCTYWLLTDTGMQEKEAASRQGSHRVSVEHDRKRDIILTFDI